MMNSGCLLVSLLMLTTSPVAVLCVDELDSPPVNEFNYNAHSIPTHQQGKNGHRNENVFQLDQSKEYLSNKLAKEVCQLDRGASRLDRLSDNTYLSHCSRYKLANLLSNEALDILMHNSTERCQESLDDLVQLDEQINDYWTLFEDLLSRYNCHNGYSVKWTCEDCKVAYRDWLCATSLPYFMQGERIKPCFSFCERVEQRCPYLNPIAKEQYGGQPVFICRDPNIPFVPEITPDIPYENAPKCYELCHLSANHTELENDSLSRYRFNHCPREAYIAKNVRD